MPDPIDITQGVRKNADCVDPSVPGNDNLDEFDNLTKQGLVLLKAFHDIEDPEVRYQVLCHVQALANNGKMQAAIDGDRSD